MDLLDAAPIDKQTHSETERELVTFLHKMSVKKYATPQDMIIPAELDVKENIDLQVAKAERHFYNCDYVQCNRITTSVIREHTFHEDCLPIHISCLVELQKSNGNNIISVLMDNQCTTVIWRKAGLVVASFNMYFPSFNLKDFFPSFLDNSCFSKLAGREVWSLGQFIFLLNLCSSAICH